MYPCFNPLFVRLFLLLGVVLCLGCGTEDNAAPPSDGGQDATTDGGNDAAPSPDSHQEDSGEAPPAPRATHWCEAGLGALPGAREAAQDFAAAHVGQRLFGPSADWLGADAKLVALLETSPSFGPPLLSDYAAAFDEVCVLEAQNGEGEPSTVELLGTIALIHPGTDAPVVPEEATHIVVDLRSPRPDANIRAAAGAALSQNVGIGTRQIRFFTGFPGQEEGWTHYEVSQIEKPLTIEALGQSERPLAFLVGSQLTPEAALIAGGLRLAGRASVVGWDIHTAVAEATWTGVGNQGLLWRGAVLKMNAAPWPDVIPADQSTTAPLAALDEGFPTRSATQALGPYNRSLLADYIRDAGKPPTDLSTGAMRAMLLVAYGTLDWFYPYFEVVGRDLDSALIQGLSEIEGLEANDRAGMKHVLGRFLHDLYDGHGYYWDEGGTDWPDGYLAVQIQAIDGEAVIRSSVHDGLWAGDTIVSIDGTPATAWYEEAMSRYSATSEGYRFVMATGELQEITGTRTLELRNPAGELRNEVVGPESYTKSLEVPWGGSFKPSGWLSDMDAPNIYYVNMSGSVTPDVTPIMESFATLLKADGMVLDMRDYPNLDIYEFARFFNPAYFSAPLFGFPTWAGPNAYELITTAWEFDPAATVYVGPIVLLVSHHSVSAAECFGQMIAALPNVTIMGQPSAATNGTITTVQLPGGFGMNFTGMRLVNPDGSEFHGIGLVPDIPVDPTPAQFAAGEDPELQAAITHLLTL